MNLPLPQIWNKMWKARCSWNRDIPGMLSFHNELHIFPWHHFFSGQNGVSLFLCHFLKKVKESLFGMQYGQQAFWHFDNWNLTELYCKSKTGIFRHPPSSWSKFIKHTNNPLYWYKVKANNISVWRSLDIWQPWKSRICCNPLSKT